MMLSPVSQQAEFDMGRDWQ